jgi:hypothetical protein
MAANARSVHGRGPSFDQKLEMKRNALKREVFLIMNGFGRVNPNIRTKEELVKK